MYKYSPGEYESGERGILRKEIEDLKKNGSIDGVRELRKKLERSIERINDLESDARELKFKLKKAGLID